MTDPHPFQRSAGPRKRLSCVKCGRQLKDPIHTGPKAIIEKAPAS